MFYGNILCRDTERLANIIKPGDKVNASLYIGHRMGWYCEGAEVRFVDHWGVYVVVRDEKILPSYRKDIIAQILKRQFKVKWKNITGFRLTA